MSRLPRSGESNSRIRPSSKSTSFPSMAIRIIFAVVIALAILAGIFGPSRSEAHYQVDPGVVLLRDAGVSFVHPVNSLEVLIFRGGEGYREGFKTADEVCTQLKTTDTVIQHVRFFNGPRASCR